MTLHDITEGKIFVEAERATLSRILAGMKEEEGDIDKAQEVMQDVAVETYGALDKREKTDFILEQARLSLFISIVGMHKAAVPDMPHPFNQPHFRLDLLLQRKTLYVPPSRAGNSVARCVFDSRLRAPPCLLNLTVAIICI